MAVMRRGQARRSALVATTLSFILVIAALAVSALPASARSVIAQSAPVQSAAVAQTAPIIESADLRIWPEYDDPGLLVIFSGQFAEGTNVPFQASFPIPAGARNIQATYQDDSGTLINRPFEVKDGKLVYELPSRGFHYEYYVDRAPSGEQRDIAFEFEAPYAIDALRVAVQQPARATGFALAPAAENSETGTDSLTYHILNRRNLALGEKLGLEIKYTKADSGLTAPQLAVAPTSAAALPAASAPATTTTAATGVTNLLPWLLIALGLVLGAGVLVYWWMTSQRRSAQPAAPMPAKGGATLAGQGSARPVQPPARAAARPQSAESVSFCTNCGHGLKAEDRFCSQCGAPRRS